MGQDDYNGVMGAPKMGEALKRLERERPELFSDFEAVRQETLDRIAADFAPAEQGGDL